MPTLQTTQILFNGFTSTISTIHIYHESKNTEHDTLC